MLKNKVVEFPLSEIMRLPDLIKKGYQRHEVIALFTELQAKAMGTYTEGTQGKGKCATFEFCMEFPQKYAMTFQVEKLHTDYAGKPTTNSNEPPRRISAENKPIVDNNNQENTLGNWSKIIMSSGNQVRRTSLTASQYKILVEDNSLKVSLVDNGAPTIESALEKVWDSVKDKIKEPKYQHMTALEAVSSRLMGHGYYNY